MSASNLPPRKTLDVLVRARVPKVVLRRVDELSRGDFIGRAENVLVFGKPGVGKSHIACGLGHALDERGHSVCVAPTYQLVQQLLAARRDLSLPRALRQLDAFDLVLLDDIGYVQQSADEAEVLATLINDNHQPRQMDITNLATTGRSSCRRPAILVDLDQKGVSDDAETHVLRPSGHHQRRRRRDERLDLRLQLAGPRIVGSRNHSPRVAQNHSPVGPRVIGSGSVSS